MLSLLVAALLLSIAGQVHSQSASYAPSFVPCPSTPLLRDAGQPQSGNQSLSPKEFDYIQSRETRVLPGAWRQYLSGKASNTGYNVDRLLRNNPPRIAIAISGGGYRAALFGAGVLSALDQRNQSGVTAGTGGVLQSAAYISGLSAGAWTVGSFAINDWPTVPNLVLGSGPGWFTDLDMLTPGGLNNSGTANNLEYYNHVQTDIDLKRNAGFAVSITVRLKSIFGSLDAAKNKRGK
jgi:lysophospholipase